MGTPNIDKDQLIERLAPLTLEIILDSISKIEGWLKTEEAELLIETTARALNDLPTCQAIVEIGSYCGRSTIAIGKVVQRMAPTVRVYAIDPHEGELGASGIDFYVVAPTLNKLTQNIAQENLTDVVQILQQYSYNVNWHKPIGMLFIDALHDYKNVACDFYQFSSWVSTDGYIAFHDYADYYPGVKSFVDEILAGNHYHLIDIRRSLIVLQKVISSHDGILEK